MSGVTYDSKTFTVYMDDKDVKRALGDLRSKTPAVLKFAVNKAARYARREVIAEARRRYALTARGNEKLKHLNQTKKATNKSPSATLKQDDKGLQLDLSYFQHTPEEALMGWQVRHAPRHFRARVLKGHPMRDLTEETGKSKGFLVRVYNPRAQNTHLMMVQRKLGAASSHTETRRGLPRWTNAAGQVEKLDTMNRIGASSMERAVWERGVDQSTAENLEKFVEQRLRQVIAKSKGG